VKLTWRGLLVVGLALAALVPSAAWAQLSVSCRLARGEFMLYEPVEVEVAISNYSARPVSLEAREGKPWLQVMVAKPNGELLPVTGELQPEVATIASGQTVARRFNLLQLFQVGAPGKYVVHVRVTAPDGREFQVQPQQFLVANGVVLWEDTVGIEVPPKDPADPAQKSEEQYRTYSLLQFTAQRGRNFLYVQVEDKTKETIYGVFSLGTYLPFVKPQARTDKARNLHLLFQSGSRLFNYVKISPDARITEQFALSNILSSPNLAPTEDGQIIVSGGERQRAE
jgi:hypothetical protein